MKTLLDDGIGGLLHKVIAVHINPRAITPARLLEL